MATYIKPDAVKDSSIAKSKLDTALANEINGKLTDAPKDGKVYGRSDGEWVGVDSNWEFIRSESFADYGGGDHRILLAEVAKYKEVKWIISKDTADDSLSGWIRPSIGYFVGWVFRSLILGWTNIYTSGLKLVQYSGWIAYDNTIDFEFAKYDKTSAQASASGTNIEMKQCYIPTEQEKEIIDNPASAYIIPLVAGSYNGTETIYIYGKRR